MTCKDCIHYEACGVYVNTDIFKDVEVICREFEDESLYIKLPCKVGDTVHSYCGNFGVILPYFIETLSCTYYDKNSVVWQYEANCSGDDEAELLDSIDFEFDDIGKTVFLTREAAEAALKEREK